RARSEHCADGPRHGLWSADGFDLVSQRIRIGQRQPMTRLGQYRHLLAAKAVRVFDRNEPVFCPPQHPAWDPVEDPPAHRLLTGSSVALRPGLSDTGSMQQTKAAQTQATREKLERVARELFAQRGFAGVSAEELVAKAGVTRGALYHHYDGKEGLFEAV